MKIMNYCHPLMEVLDIKYSIGIMEGSSLVDDGNSEGVIFEDWDN